MDFSLDEAPDISSVSETLPPTKEKKQEPAPQPETKPPEKEMRISRALDEAAKGSYVDKSADMFFGSGELAIGMTKDQKAYQRIKELFDDVDIDSMPDSLKEGLLHAYGAEIAKEQYRKSIRQEARYGVHGERLGTKILDAFGKTIYEIPRGLARRAADLLDADAYIGDLLLGENGKPATDILKKGSTAIRDWLNRKGIAGEIVENFTEDEAERIQDMYANGEWGNLFAEYMLSAAAGGLATATKMSLLPGGGLGKASPKDFIRGINWSALARAGEIGLAQFLTTDGELKESVKAGALMSLFASTSAVTSLASSDWKAKVYDVIGNLATDMVPGTGSSVWDAVDRVRQRGTNPDGTVTLDWGALIAELAPIVSTSFVFGMMQQSARVRNAKIDKAAVVKKLTENKQMTVEEVLKELAPEAENTGKTEDAAAKVLSKINRGAEEYIKKVEEKGMELKPEDESMPGEKPLESVVEEKIPDENKTKEEVVTQTQEGMPKEATPRPQEKTQEERPGETPSTETKTAEETAKTGEETLASKADGEKQAIVKTPVEKTKTEEVQNAVQEDREGQVSEPVGKDVQQKTGEPVLRDEGVQIPTEKENIEKSEAEQEDISFRQDRGEEIIPEEKDLPPPQDKNMKLAQSVNDVFDNIRAAPKRFRGVLQRIANRIKELGEAPSEKSVDNAVRAELADMASVYATPDVRGRIIKILAKPNVGAQEIHTALKLMESSINKSFTSEAVARYRMKKDAQTRMDAAEAADAVQLRQNELKRIQKALKAMRPKTKEDIAKEKTAAEIKKDIEDETENRAFLSDYIHRMFGDSEWQKTAEAKVAISALKKRKLKPSAMADILEMAEKYAEWALRKDSLEAIEKSRRVQRNNFDEWSEEDKKNFGDFFSKFDAREKIQVLNEDGTVSYVKNTAELDGMKTAVEAIKANEELQAMLGEEQLAEWDAVSKKRVSELSSDDLSSIRRMMDFINRNHANKREIFIQGKLHTVKEAVEKIKAAFDDVHSAGEVKHVPKWLEVAQSYLGLHLQLDTQLRLVNDVLKEVVMGQLEEGARVPNKLLSELKEIEDRYNATFTPEELTSFSDSYSRSGLLKKASTRIHKVKLDNMPEEVPFTPSQIASLLLAARDPDGYKILTHGNLIVGGDNVVAVLKRTNAAGQKKEISLKRLTDDDLARLESLLTRKERAFMNAVFEWHNSSVRDHLNNGSRNYLGYEIATGSNHWSLERHAADTKSVQNQDIDYMARGALNTASLMHPSITRKRIGGDARLVIGDLIDRVREEAGIVHAYEAFSRPMDTARKIMRNPDIINAIKQARGLAFYDNLNKHFAAIEGTLAKPEENTWFERLTSKTAAGIIALSPTAINQQPLALLTSYNVLGSSGLKSAAKLRIMDTRLIRLINDTIDSNNMLSERINGSLMGPEIGSAMNEQQFFRKLTGHEPWLARQFFAMEETDKWTMRRNVLGAIDKTAMEYGLTLADILNETSKYEEVKTQFLSDAADLAWRSIVKGGQGVYNPIYRSSFQLRHRALARLVGVFHTQRDQFIDTNVNAFLDWRDGKKSNAEFGASILVGFFAPIIAQSFIKLAYKHALTELSYPDKDERDDYEQRDRVFKYLDENTKNPRVYNLLLKSAVECASTGYYGEVAQYIDSAVRYHGLSGGSPIINNPLISTLDMAARGSYDVLSEIPVSEDSEWSDVNKDKVFRGVVDMSTSGVRLLGVSTNMLKDAANVIHKRYFSESEN